MDSLYKTLDEEGKREFLKQLKKACGIDPDTKAGAVRIVGDDIFDRQAVSPEEFITRTMIKKVYKNVKKVDSRPHE